MYFSSWNQTFVKLGEGSDSPLIFIFFFERLLCVFFKGVVMALLLLSSSPPPTLPSSPSFLPYSISLAGSDRLSPQTTPSITPAVMRLNLSVSTGHAHTQSHPLKRAHYFVSHAWNQHKPDSILQLAHLALLQRHTHTFGTWPSPLIWALPLSPVIRRPVVRITVSPGQPS